MVTPTDAHGLIAPLNKIVADGIPTVTTVNELSDASGVTAAVAVDNYSAGQRAADYMAEALQMLYSMFRTLTPGYEELSPYAGTIALIFPGGFLCLFAYYSLLSCSLHLLPARQKYRSRGLSLPYHSKSMIQAALRRPTRTFHGARALQS